MRNNNEDLFDIKKFIPAKREDSSVEQRPQAPVTQQFHQDFGNTHIQAALSGEGGLFNDMIQGMMAMETADMSLGESASASGFLGNMGIQRMIMRKGLTGGRDGEKLPDASDSRVQNIKQSGGSALPPALLSHLNSIFQHDFSHVRIHTSGRDNASATAVNAHAFTLGNHIYFNAGEYNPGSARGMETLTHELTHVMQNDEGRISTSSNGLEVSDPSSSIEREAYAKGASISREYGAFRAPSAAESVASTESLFDAPMPETVSAYMNNQIQSPTPMTLDSIIMDAMGMATSMMSAETMGSSLGDIGSDSSFSTPSSTSSSGAIMREARSGRGSGSNAYSNELAPVQGAPQPTMLPNMITIDGGRLGQLTASKQRNGQYKIEGNVVDMEFNPVRLTRSEDGWSGEITYNIKPSSDKIFQYSLVGERKCTLTVNNDGVGTMTAPDVETAEIKMGGLGKITIQDVSFDEGGFAGTGVFTPSDECFCYLKEIMPSAEVTTANITVSRRSGQWDANGSMTLKLAVGELDIMSVTVTVTSGENGPEYTVEGELSLGSDVSDETGGTGNANVTGSFNVDGEGNSSFRVTGEVSASQLMNPSGTSKFMPEQITGSAMVGFDSTTGFFASGTLGASLKLPFSEDPWRFSGTLAASEEDGLTVIGRVSGKKDIESSKLAPLGGSMSMQLNGNTVWDVENSQWRSSELSLGIKVGKYITGTGTVRYDGEADAWDNDLEIEGKLDIKPFGGDKKIPDPFIDVGNMMPRMTFPVFGPIVIEVFVDGEAGVKVKPPKFNLGVKAGLNLNSATDFLDSLTVKGGVDMEAKASANASVNAGVGVNVLLASGGAGIYGELGAEANASASANIELDLLRNGVSPEGGFNLTDLNADINMDAVLYGELGLYAYVDTILTSEKRFEYPFGRVDVAKWGPLTAGLGLKTVDDKMQVEAEGFSGYDKFDFSPLRNAVNEGIEHLKNMAGYGKGTDIDVVLTNNNYRDEEAPELYVKVDGHDSRTVKIPRGRLSRFTMNAKTMSDTVQVEVYDSDWGFDDQVINTRWSTPFNHLRSSGNGVTVELDVDEE